MLKEVTISSLSAIVIYEYPKQLISEEYLKDDGTTGIYTTFADAPELVGIRHKDGTLQANLAGGGWNGYLGDNDVDYTSMNGFMEIVDLEDIDAFLFYKGEFSEENPTEDMFYLVEPE